MDNALRNLNKERYLVRLGCKPKNQMDEPFKNSQKEEKRFAEELYDDTGNIVELVLENKILSLEKEWNKLRGGLDEISSHSSKVLKQNKAQNRSPIDPHLGDGATESKIRSEKNQPAKGDVTQLYEKLMNENKKKEELLKATTVNKPHIKPTKPSTLLKGNKNKIWRRLKLKCDIGLVITLYIK